MRSDSDLKWKGGKAVNKDRKLTIMRGAKTRANYTHGMGGLPRKVNKAKPITLPKTPWDDDETPDPFSSTESREP